MNKCIAIKATGRVCDNKCTGANVRCGQHLKVLLNKGPFANARDEMSYTHKFNLKNLRATNDALIQQEQNPDIRNEMRVRFRHQEEDLQLRQRHEMDDLLVTQTREIRRTGIDPDAEARLRQQQRRQEMIERDMRIERQIQQQAGAARQNDEARPDLRMALDLLHRQQQLQIANLGELAYFARDNQNVHTRAAVQQTKTYVERILKIVVPQEYRWNMNECSKTPGEIITECKLTPKAAWQMSAKYCQDEDIYNLGKGIYGKVLDGVWQFIKNSPDKEDLYRALKQEMEDNIGMCAQGNLSRLCNILAGYMEGIGTQESIAEILGRKLPLLVGIENQSERLDQAYKLFMELGVPKEEWRVWVEPLVESGEVKMLMDDNGNVLGLMAQ